MNQGVYSADDEEVSYEEEEEESEEESNFRKYEAERYMDDEGDEEEFEEDYYEDEEEEYEEDDSFAIQPLKRKGWSYNPSQFRKKSAGSPSLRKFHIAENELETLPEMDLKKFKSSLVSSKLASGYSSGKKRRKRIFSSPEEIKEKRLAELQRVKHQARLDRLEREKCKVDPDRKHTLREANKFLKAVIANHDPSKKELEDMALSEKDENPLNYIISWKRPVNNSKEYTLKEKGIFKSRRIVFAQ